MSDPTIGLTTTVCCFTTLSNVVAAINEGWKSRWNMSGTGMCFRGADDQSYNLNPSLNRDPYPSDPARLSLIENNLWSDFRIRSLPLLGRRVGTAWEAMLIMQQHGFPTRFLDWSQSLAVAAYFAVRDVDSENDGAVWVMAARHLMKLRGYGSDVWKTVVGDPLLEPYALREGIDGLEEFLTLSPVAVVPDQLVARIAAQKSIYTLHSFERFALETLAAEDRKQHGNACFLHKLIIPKGAKLGIRKEIEVVAGVSEDALFPDLDGFARSFVTEQKLIARGLIGPG